MKSLRATVAALLPDGLTPDDFPNLVEADGFRGGRGAVVTDAAVARLTPREDLPTQDDYDALIKAQVAAKEEYVSRVLALLDRVERRGEDAAGPALARFRAAAAAELEAAFVRGVGATAEGDARDPRFRAWLASRVNFEAGRFSEFVGRVLAGTEAMPRERRADLYGRTLDHAFNRGAFAVYGNDVRIHSMLSPAEHCCLLDPTSRVLTFRGLVPIAEVTTDDMVLTHRGRWRRVLRTLRHAPRTQRRATFRSPVTGREVTCTDDHPWFSEGRWKRAYDLESAEEIARSPLWEMPREARSEEPLRRLHRMRVPVSGNEILSRLRRKEGRADAKLPRLRSAAAHGADVCRDNGGLFFPLRPCDATGTGPVYGDVPQRGGTEVCRLPGALALGARLRSDFAEDADSPRQRRQDGRPFGEFGRAFRSGPQAAAFSGKIRFDDLPADSVLYDLAVEEDASFVVEGLVSHNSDCIERAARGPYLPPGRGDGDPDGLPELPSFPRDGATECLGNCKCYLIVEKRGEGDEEPTYEAGDRVVEPGVRIEDGDETALDDYGDDEIAEIQDEADGYVEQAQYARAMHDLQVDGDEIDWLEARREANEKLIDLQDRTGLRFVPRTGADAVSLTARELPPQGYEPVGPADRSRVVEGIDAAAADGTDYTFGVVTKYDPATGTGVYTDQTGEAIPFDLAATSNRIVLGVRRGKGPRPSRAWKAPAASSPDGVRLVDPEGVSYVVEEPGGPYASALIGTARSALFDPDAPPDAPAVRPGLFGAQVRVVPSVEAPQARGAVALVPADADPSSVRLGLAGVAVPALFAAKPPPAELRNPQLPAGFRSPVSPLAVAPDLRPRLDDWLHWYAQWLADPDSVPEDVADYYEGFEDEDFDDPDYPPLDPDGRFEENDDDYYAED